MKHFFVTVATAGAFALSSSAASTVFSDDFEDDAIGANPAIGGVNIGLAWADEVNSVDVVANPSATGNTSGQVLQGNFSGSNLNGNMNGWLLNSVFMPNATISVDFFVPNLGGVNNGPNIRLMSTNLAGNWSGFGGLTFEKDGDIDGAGLAFNDGVTPGTKDLNHFGVDIWQNATWTYGNFNPNYSETQGSFDISITLKNLATGETVSDTGLYAFNLASWTGLEEMTLVNPNFTGNSAHACYIDNLIVEGDTWFLIPEPSSLALMVLGCLGLGLFRRRA